MRDFAILMLLVPAIAGLVVIADLAINAHSWLMATCDEYRRIFESGKTRRLILQVMFALMLSLLAGSFMLLEG